MAGIAAAELEFLALAPSMDTALATLVDPIRRWFTQFAGSPTTAQRLAWPAIAAGKHLLLSAPTGSGKTLAAFLPLFNRLLANRAYAIEATQPESRLRCVYVSPS